MLDLDGGRPVVLDAGIGTRLIARGLDLRFEVPCLWVLDRPDEIRSLHQADAQAGADAILTATFGATPILLGRFGRIGDAERIDRLATALAHETGKAVIGSVAGFGPIDEARAQAERLAKAGCDAIALETAWFEFAERFLISVRKTVPIPIIASLIEPDGPVPDHVARLEDLGADVVGANCHGDLDQAARDVEVLARAARVPIWIKPGGGLPGRPPIGPEAFEAAARRWIEAGARFVGGCCGTDERHVAAIRRAVDSQPA